MADIDPVSDKLCVSRMETIDTKLSSILDKVDILVMRIDATKLASHDDRIKDLENWKSGFTITKIISTISGATAGVLVIYETLKRFLL